MKIYTASSWRNERYPAVVNALKAEGYEVYDFRNPWDEGAAFNWEQIDPNWENWGAYEFVEALKHPLSERAFKSDKAGMDWADVCVLILPSGKSSHMEAGYMAGKGKPVHILLDGGRPELTYKLANTHASFSSLLVALKVESEIKLAGESSSKAQSPTVPGPAPDQEAHPR